MDEKIVPPRYTAEFRERGVRLFQDHRSGYASDNAAYRSIASKLGCSKDSPRVWCVQAARNAGECAVDRRIIRGHYRGRVSKCEMLGEALFEGSEIPG